MRVLIYISFILVFFSCSSERKQLNESEYQEWYKAHHSELTKTKTLEDITVNISLVPTESIYIRNKDPESTLEDYKGMISFKVELNNNRNIPMLKYLATAEKTYQERIYYYTNLVKQHITLKQDGNETVFPTDVIMDRNYGINPHLTLNVLFKDIELKSPITLHYDEVVYNLGPLNFHYSQEELNAIPTLEDPNV